jgi:hypothetical protein
MGREASPRVKVNTTMIRAVRILDHSSNWRLTNRFRKSPGLFAKNNWSSIERGVMEQHELLVLREADIELDDLCTVRQHLL